MRSLCRFSTVCFGFALYLAKRLFTQKAPIRERDREEVHRAILHLFTSQYSVTSCSRRKGFYSSSELLAHFFLPFFFFLIGPVEKLCVLILASSTHDPLHLSAWAGVVVQSHLEIKQIKKLKIAEWVMRPANWWRHKSPPVTAPPLPAHIWILLWFYRVCIYEPNLLESNTIRLIYKQVLVRCQ